MDTLSTVQHIYSIVDRFNFYSSLINLVVGLSGNFLLILIFTNVKAFRGNQCSFYLTVESISNIGLLITNYSLYILNTILGYDLTLTSLPYCKVRSMLLQLFGLFSIYIISCNTLDQYLATNHRYSLRQMSTLKLAHRFALFLLCFCTLHSTLFLIFTEISPTEGCTVVNSIFKKYLSFCYFLVLANGIPVMLTITFSLLAYRNVRRIVRRQVPILRRRLDRQLTAMVLTRVVSGISLGLPFIFITLYQLNLTTDEDNLVKLAIVYLLSYLSYFFLYASYSVRHIFPLTIIYIFSYFFRSIFISSY